MAILEMKGIRKGFSGEEIIKGIDLSCREGEVLSIIGPSGSGKSTLLRIATFLETADSGTIIYGGKPVFQRETVFQKVPVFQKESKTVVAGTKRTGCRRRVSLVWSFKTSIYSHIGAFWKIS